MFALLHHSDGSSADPLNLQQWSFLVLSTKKLNAVFGEQESVTLGSLRSRGRPDEVSYDGLHAAVAAAAAVGSPVSER